MVLAEGEVKSLMNVCAVTVDCASHLADRVQFVKWLHIGLYLKIHQREDGGAQVQYFLFLMKDFFFFFKQPNCLKINRECDAFLRLYFFFVTKELFFCCS